MDDHLIPFPADKTELTALLAYVGLQQLHCSQLTKSYLVVTNLRYVESQ
jgi:hypothetical protein